MNKLWCIRGRKDCKLWFDLPAHIHPLYTVHYPPPMAPFIGLIDPCVPRVTRISLSPSVPPSFSFFLPLSLRLLRPSIIHEVQRPGESERVRLHAKTVEESDKKGGNREGQRKQTHLLTLKSCVSARWLDGRLCEEREERTDKRGRSGARFSFFLCSLSYHSQVHIHLYWWAEFSRRSTLWRKERGRRQSGKAVTVKTKQKGLSSPFEMYRFVLKENIEHENYNYLWRRNLKCYAGDISVLQQNQISLFKSTLKLTALVHRH